MRRQRRVGGFENWGGLFFDPEPSYFYVVYHVWLWILIVVCCCFWWGGGVLEGCLSLFVDGFLGVNYAYFVILRCWHEGFIDAECGG